MHVPSFFGYTSWHVFHRALWTHAQHEAQVFCRPTAGQRQREGKRLEERRVEEKESEERRCRCAKRQESRETLSFSNDLRLRRVEKSRLAKAAGAEPAGQMRDEKFHAVVARSTFPSQNVQNTSASDHFWKLRCRKSARHCGAKHISKSKCTKHLSVGPPLEVEMSKKCTPLWREAHFQVKMHKTHTFGPLLEVEMSKKCTPLWREDARSTFRSQNVKNKHHMFAPLLDDQMSFCVAGARDCRSCQKWAKGEGFVAFPKTMAGVGLLKRICKDAFSVAGAVQKTCSWEMLGGQGAHFLRGVAFWSGASDL